MIHYLNSNNNTWRRLFWFCWMSATLLLSHHGKSAVCNGYFVSSSSSRGSGMPELTRRAMTGLWKLKQQAIGVPLKEFTVYQTTKRKKQYSDGRQEVWLLLKEDGSFQQYNSNQEFATTRDVLEQAKAFQGTWDYRDGKLILAADRRASIGNYKDKDNGNDNDDKNDKPQDTILVGRVVAKTSETKPQVGAEAASPVDEVKKTEAAPTKARRDTPKTVRMDPKSKAIGYLSVPKGKVKVGKFFYPKHHPLFFDQPIFKPIPQGSFQLKQVLGESSLGEEDDVPEEKFDRRDFYNKTFLLTSQPLENKRPKGNVRWSIKYNKYVRDLSPKMRAEEDARRNAPVRGIRVMQLQFFTNNTFSTVAGLGQAAILRGKFDVVGTDKDQLWMQVSRFGFGRSVSGSVYSEGKGLSHEDAKMYWGQISYEENKSDHENELDSSSPDPPPASSSTPKETESANSNTLDTTRLQVQGSVMFGSGLDPMPVGRFIMKELVDLTADDDDEDEEEDDEEDSIVLPKFDADEEDNSIDWSNAFQ